MGIANGQRESLEDSEVITISTDRFKCLYAIKCAAVTLAKASPHYASPKAKKAHKRLADKFKELAAIEARDFVNGIVS